MSKEGLVCLKAYLLLLNTEVVLIKRLSPNLVTLYVYSGNRMWRTEMGARRKVQRKENVNEVSEGMETQSGNIFTHTFLG